MTRSVFSTTHASFMAQIHIQLKTLSWNNLLSTIWTVKQHEIFIKSYFKKILHKKGFICFHYVIFFRKFTIFLKIHKWPWPDLPSDLLSICVWRSSTRTCSWPRFMMYSSSFITLLCFILSRKGTATCKIGDLIVE